MTNAFDHHLRASSIGKVYNCLSYLLSMFIDVNVSQVRRWSRLLVFGWNKYINHANVIDNAVGNRTLLQLGI